MAKFKVTAPTADYSGKTGEVQFADGVAIVDDEANPMELAYCRTAGYSVEPVEPAGDEPPAKTTRKPAAKADPKEGAEQ